jgi:serine/threonine-protein kinase
MATTERSRQRGFAVPLALRLFIGTALLIAFAVGAAVLVTYFQGRRIADQAVGKALTTSAAVQREFEQRRLENLQLAARLIAADAGFVKYISDAAGASNLPGLGGDSAPDTGSMRDLLLERQKDFAIDLAMLLDPRGEVLARTDESEAFKASLAKDPLVASAVRDAAPFSGYWRQGDKLYQAAVMPLAQDQDLTGFLLVALAVDDALSKSVAQVSGAEIAFLLPRDDGVALVASSFETPASVSELKQTLAAHKADLQPAVQAGRTLDRVPLHIASQDWVAHFAPTAAPGEAQLGTVAVLSSTDQLVGSYKKILNWVILAGIASLLVALLLSSLLARGILRPIGAMAEAAESAAAGDYRTRIGRSGSDALGRLARAFDSLLSDLREKSDMEGYVGHLARYLPEPTGEKSAASAPPAATAEAPRRANASVLGVEFRHLATPADTSRPPGLVASDLAGVRALLSTVANAAGARVVDAGGARWLLVLEGDRRLGDASRAWASIVQDAAVARVPAPAGAIAESELVCVSDADSSVTFRSVLGAAAAQVDRLLCDAGPGQLLATRSAGDALKGELPDDALSVATGAFSGKRYYAIAAAVLPKLAADAATTYVRRRVTPRAADRAEIAPGTTLGGRYRVISTLGAGGMGVVYKAHDLELDDVVALKMLRPGVLLDAEQLDRLKSEIKLARRITHPNVLRTFDFGEVDGRPYISMEYVRGLTLRYLLGETERVPYSAALRIARQLSAGLAAAHEVGVLHRDIKPENLILEANGNAKLMDFGIARPSRRAEPGHTQPGTFIGTPNYCAPEQLTGDDVDERGDIYACGVVMSEMFCGGLPFTGANTMEIYQAQLRNEPILPSQLWPEIPHELEAVILRCLRRDREERYASARELNAALTELRA